MSRAMTTYINYIRYYIHPVTGEMVPGVTSVLDVLDKPGLDNWKVDETAKYAVANLDILAKVDPAQAVDMVKRATKVTTKTAAEKGTDVHAILEDLANGIPVLRTPSNGWVLDTWEAFNRENTVEVVEVEPTFWHPGITKDEDGKPTHGYAGSADLVAYVNGRLAILDWKTVQGGIYGEVSLQLCGYGMAPYIIRPDGTIIDFRETYGEVQETYAVWLRPEDLGPKYVGAAGWSLIPMQYDETTWLTFRAVRIAWEWQNVHSQNAVGKPVNAHNIGTKRAKARKAVA